MKCRYCGKETNGILDVCSECTNKSNETINTQNNNIPLKDKSKTWFIISWIILFLCGPFSYLSAMYWNEFAWIALLTYSYFVFALIFIAIILSIVEIINLNKLKKNNSDNLGVASTRYTLINFGYLLTIVTSTLFPIKISLLAIILSIWCVVSIIIVKNTSKDLYKLALITSIILLIASTVSGVYLINGMFFDGFNKSYEKQREKELEKEKQEFFEASKKANKNGINQELADIIYDLCDSEYTTIYLSKNSNSGLFQCNNEKIFAINADKAYGNYYEIKKLNNIYYLNYNKNAIYLVQGNNKSEAINNNFDDLFDSINGNTKHHYMIYYVEDLADIKNNYDLLFLFLKLIDNDEGGCWSASKYGLCEDTNHGVLKEYLNSVQISSNLEKLSINAHVDFRFDYSSGLHQTTYSVREFWQVINSSWSDKKEINTSEKDKQIFIIDRKYDKDLPTIDDTVDIYIRFQDNGKSKFIKYISNASICKLQIDYSDHIEEIDGKDQIPTQILVYVLDSEYDVLFKASYLPKAEIIAVKSGSKLAISNDDIQIFETEFMKYINAIN